MKKKTLRGLIKRHPDGFGFFVPEDHEHPDVYIPRHSMTGILTNDKVLIQVEAEKGGERFRGEILEILSRGTKHVVGQFFPLNEKYGLIKDESHAWGQDLRVPLNESKNAKSGELVAAEILQFPEEEKPFLGRIIEIIGSAQEPINDLRRVIYGNQLPHTFSEKAQAEADTFEEIPQPKDFAHRVDLRKKLLITIDGVTAKDFDDAVCVETSAKGFRLYVAIADVSHYVKPGTAIDAEAYERGTSVYFPNFVVPMLPEVLSNGLCSLMPHVPRLCLVAEMEFDFTGEKLSSKFYEAVMQSHARVTYGEAQEVIEGNDLPRLKPVEENILRCADLAKILMAKRFRDGSLDLEIPETQLEIDASGVPVDVIRSERLFAHRLIEELMLAANVAVAEHFTSKEIPALYRIHESPNEDAIRILENYLKSFGSHVNLSSGKLQKRLTRALQEFSGKPAALALNILTLRSMSQAKYSSDNVGHFGLGFDNYTHFTSPIRRYPDLIVHRLLKSSIHPQLGYKKMSEDELVQAGNWLSSCEQRSVKAERQIQAIKKARFMEKFVGQEFEGVINSVTRFGVFVLLREYDIDGLIRTEDLSKEKLEYDEEKIRLYAKRSGLSYSIGDILEIRVESTDHNLGQINFNLKSRPAKSAGKSQGHEGHRKKEHRRPKKQDEKSAAKDQTRKKFKKEPRHRGKSRAEEKQTARSKDFATKDRKSLFAKLDEAIEERSRSSKESPGEERRHQERRREDRDNPSRKKSSRKPRSGLRFKVYSR